MTSQTKNTAPIEHSAKKDNPVSLLPPVSSSLDFPKLTNTPIGRGVLMDHNRSFLWPLGPDAPGVCNYSLRP
jgi:hypothetical protein